ncbi:MAG TPA: ABC transporter substrate-binding protein [Deltaproteobacteria bacterium]|nr:ABC transporter substrate-binding protein [Deltaproteobacteria bacterium]HQI01137.1 ABC transporter substrate-binding protein [Deltaproteobacteria bacterium]HQJ07495.1 ABC transporter substrate-binding protein [Deltaproteobacteria bacterium]
MNYIPQLKRLFLISILSLLCACASQGKFISSESPKVLYSRAVNQEAYGDLDGAYRTYILLREAYPDNELAPKALYRAAEISSARSPGRAVELYRTFLASYPKSPLMPQARQGLLEGEIKLGAYSEAYDLFTYAFSHDKDPRLIQTGMKLIRGLHAQKDYPRVLSLICMIFPHADKPSQEALLGLWKTAVAGTDRVDALEGIEDKVLDDRLLGILLAHEARMYADKGEKDVAASIVSRIGPGVSLTSMDGQYAPARKTRVGVLLPLSGKLESVGQRVLRGIEFASNIFSTDPAPQVEYLIRDYGENEQAIPGLIEQLDTKDKVDAVIGPIGESAGGLACKEVQKRGIPSIMFTRAQAPSDKESYCFSNFVSVDIQVENLLKAAADRGITRFAILYPTDNFGRIFASTFAQKSKSFGIEVVKQMEYPQGQGNFKGIIQRLIKSPVSSGPGKPKLPGPGFEALLIPDTASNASMIASYLPYFNIRGIRLFGPNLWDSPDFVRMGGRNVENAIFVSGFFTDSERKAVQEFNSRFNATFGYKPSIWEASAYDSASIIQNMTDIMPSSRKGLREQIGLIKDYPGLTGTTSFSRDGRVKKTIYVLTVRNQAVEEIIP